MTQLRWMTQGDADLVVAAQHLFDEPARVDATRTFLELPTHHLCIAYEGDVPAGFVSGVETTHPDKGTEMFLYELAVDEAHRRRGIGRALVAALAERAKTRGCYGMWVLTDRDNTAGVRTYESAGGADEGEQLMIGWKFVS
jgi:ribosomal protein S18 acetylase RimI-like enzyme